MMIPRSSFLGRSVVCITVLLLLTTCSPKRGPVVQPPLHPPAPIRLVEMLERSSVVKSPLLGSTALATLTADTKQESVLFEDFSDPDPSRLNWPETTRFEQPPGGEGLALHLAEGRAKRFAIVLPAEPNAYYRVSRRVRTDQPTIDLRVVEGKRALKHPDTLNHPADTKRIVTGGFVAINSLAFVHRFPRPTKLGSWSRDEILFRTRGLTKTIILIVDDAEATAGKISYDVWLDDLRVDRFFPSFQEKLGLVKGAYLAAGADPSLGIVKHGQLLPTANNNTVSFPYDHNFDFRYALLAPTPTTLRFPVHVPEHGRLNFSYALLKNSVPGDESRFKVIVETGDGKRDVVFDRTLVLDAKGKKWRWFDERVSLGVYSGQDVALILSTSAGTSKRGFALWGNPYIDAPSRKARPLNVVVIAVDTLRADRLSCDGYARSTSPRLDELAGDGVRFANATSPSNWTSATFASLFTGIMPSRHRVIQHSRLLPQDLPILPEYYNDAGWTTQGIAYKGYLYNMGFERGFDGWFNIPRDNSLAEQNIEKAMAFLDRHGDRPFFLFLHFDDPHQPFNMPMSYVKRFLPKGALDEYGAKLPMVVSGNGASNCSNCKKDGKLRDDFKETARGLYDAEVAYVDDEIGKLLDELRKRDLYDDSLIIFLSDHGEQLWDRTNVFGHGGPYLTNNLVRVPFIVKPHRSSGIGTGRVIEAPVSTISLLPTLLDFSGIEYDAGQFEALSLASMLRGAGKQVAGSPAVTENVIQRAVGVRDGKWKYIVRARPCPQAEQLYDVEADPVEKKNLAGSKPEIVGPLRRVVVDHILRNHPGYFLLVLNNPKNAKLKVVFSAADRLAQLRSWIGSPKKKKKDEVTVSFTGQAGGRIISLIELGDTPPAAASLEVHLGSKPVKVRGATANDPPLSYDPSVIDELIESGEPVALVVQSQHPFLNIVEKMGIDDHQIEVLKAMGYIQ
ncbi:MAG: sulfatase [Deltaproteobacteria bacterium]|nr:sulfatase [Deltaproteobacteria bacterium]